MNMLQEKNEKKCSGCKSSKPIGQFYKNRLVLDGHSNYCIECTRENSKKYFQRKKERVAKSENDNLMKMVLLSNFSNESDSANADNLMKILMIEKMVKSTLDEIEGLKRTYIKSDNLVTQ